MRKPWRSPHRHGHCRGRIGGPGRDGGARHRVDRYLVSRFRTVAEKGGIFVSREFSLSDLILRMKRNGLVIAIDGPSGAGKSTAARLLAERLGYIYIDTGGMYRAMGWKAKHEGI